jgi:type IV secretory pathway TraG/TraD family ATPase VirD4
MPPPMKRWFLSGIAVLSLLFILRRAVAVIAGPLGLASPALDRSEVAYRLRACLLIPECRLIIGRAIHRAVNEWTPGLWGLSLLGAAVMGWSVWSRARSPAPRSGVGSARYARSSEIRRLTLRSAGAWLPLGYLPRSRLRRCLLQRQSSCWMRRLVAGTAVCLPAEDLSRHLLVIGLTGARKTTAVTLPVLIAAAREGVSVVALDVKHGEADSLARAAAEWQRFHRDVLIFAPLDATTLRWNPLARCRTIGDAQQLTAQLFDDSVAAHPDLVYWMGAERHVCAVLCFALIMDRSDPTLGQLRSLCEAGPSAVHSYIHAHQRASMLTARLGSYLAMLPKDQAGILQGIVSRLEAWGDDSVCQATGVSRAWESIDLSRLRREPVLLLLGMPQAALGRLRWLCHLFLRDLASHLLRPRHPDESVRVLLILEELLAWGALPGLADHLATYRSRQVTVFATVQSEAQGESIYGRDGWAAVTANLVTKIYFPSLADADAERLSKVMGTAEGEDIARSRAWGARGGQRVEQRRRIPVPFRRPEELRGVGVAPDEVLVRLPHTPPARLWCPPYYTRPELAGRPDRVPRTEELVVYHHLWMRRGHKSDGDRRPEPVPAVVVPGPTAAPPPVGEGAPPLPEHSPPWPPAPPASGPASCQTAAAPSLGPPTGVAPTPSAAAAPSLEPPTGVAPKPSLSTTANTILCPGMSPSADDIAALHRFLEVLLLRVERGSQDILHGVRSGSRLVEVRVPAKVMLEMCSPLEEMHEIARRWSALRWVRRVRPTFVLNKRALSVLDAPLAQRLDAACARAPAQPPR